MAFTQLTTMHWRGKWYIFVTASVAVHLLCIQTDFAFGATTATGANKKVPFWKRIFRIGKRKVVDTLVVLIIKNYI